MVGAFESRPLSHRSEPQDFEIRAGEAHVWSAALDVPEEAFRSLEALLSPDEMDRAARLSSEAHRRRWAAARGILRSILSRYVSIRPAEILFEYTERGKPILAGRRRSGDVRFNVSHSDERFLFAATTGREIGVDIERVRVSRFDPPVARRFFSAGERALLDSTPESEWPDTFFAIWTRKEACIKASGLGLALSLGSFDVSKGASEPRVVVPRGTRAAGSASWTVADVETAPGYRAACAVEGCDLTVVSREFPL